jgi:hypothetical protein
MAFYVLAFVQLCIGKHLECEELGCEELDCEYRIVFVTLLTCLTPCLEQSCISY